MTPFVYNATVISVHDGDTLTLDVDLGFSVHVTESFRLLGCNARELSQPGGPEARNNLASLLPAGSQVQIRSVKPDKFGGRFDAAVDLNGNDLIALLIAEQWAAAWNGQGTKPVPPWPRTVQEGQ